MDSPEHGRGSMIHETEEDVEVNIDSVKDEDDWGVDDKWKLHMRKSGSFEDVDGLDYNGRKRRHESPKKVGGSSSRKADSDQDDYETRKELRSKPTKKRPEENTLDVLSIWYQDGETENKTGSRGHSRAEESEKKNSSLKYSEKHDTDVENMVNRDKGSGSVQGKKNRRRWDEPDNIGTFVDHGEKSDARNGKPLDPKSDSESKRESDDPIVTYELNDDKDIFFESITEKVVKSHEKEGRHLDSDRSNRGRSEIVVEDNKGSLKNEDIYSKERSEDQRLQRNPTRETVDGHARSSNADEDFNTWSRDRSRRDAENPMSRTPEKIGRRQSESGKDGSRDDRSKGRDDNWDDRNRDRDNVKDSWKKNQDKETRDGETNYDNMRDWEMQRRGRDRIDGRLSGRKDGNRTEAVKTSSKYGISSENYDVIEIQTKPFDYVKDNSRNIFPRNGEVFQQSDMKSALDPERSRNNQGSAQSGEETKDDQHSWRDDNNDSRGQKGMTPIRGTGCQSSSGGSLPPLGNQELGTANRTDSQGARGNNRIGRVGRGRQSGRDSPMPLVGSTFGPLGFPPPGTLQSLPPNMSPTPGAFIPPFQPPIVWPGARGIEMNMVGVPPGFAPGPLGPRFSSNLGNAPSGALVFNPSGPGIGIPPGMSSPNFNTMVRGQPQEKGWIPPRSNVPLGKAPSRGEQNDYSQNFVDTGMRPQNFIRELELTSVVEDYPKLRELIQKKDEIVANSSSPPMYYKCDLKEQALSPEFFGTKFDVILVDPPWEEYVHRAPGVTDHMNYWTFEEIMNLKIEAIADTPSFIFLWVGDGVGLEQGRQCLKKWGFRRCEDICWVKTNKSNATPGLRHDSHTLFQRSKEHCLMGIKGTVRRSTDGHIIHANIDTDVIIAEEPPYGSTAKPEDMHRIVEHFALGRRRLELFGEDHNIRSGWLTVGNGLSSSNFNSETYTRNFADKDGKMWVGGGGRNPPPEAPHLVLTTPDIESLRPKSPMKNQQQIQQQQSQSQSATISLTGGSSNNKRPENLGQNHGGSNLNLEASGSNMPSPAPWGPSMEGGHLPPGYGYHAPFGGEFVDYESQRGMNMQGN